MLRFLLTFFLIISVIPIGAQIVPIGLEWSETWDFQNELIPIAIKVDHANNIYSSATVYNEENSNIMLLKYDASKRLLWTKEFDNGNNEVVSDMHVRGHAIYLTGKADQLLFVLKYSSDGELLWAKYASVRTKGLPSLDVDAKYVYIALGNWMIKYDKISGEVFNTYKFEDNIVFDFIEVYGKNMYLAGQPVNQLQIILQKRDLEGKLLWNVTKESYWAEGVRDIDLYGSAIYVTGIQGNVIISNNNMRGVADLLLLKYDVDGSLLWERTWGTNSTLNWGFASKVYRNKLYVVGLTSTDYKLNSTSTVLQTYDRDGNMAWSIITDEINRGVAIDVKDEEIFIVGSHQDNVLIRHYVKKS
ncbi:MAG: hypothetical protein QXU32_11205 [Nitrososphaerales archaeon]